MDRMYTQFSKSALIKPKARDRVLQATLTNHPISMIIDHDSLITAILCCLIHLITLFLFCKYVHYLISFIISLEKEKFPSNRKRVAGSSYEPSANPIQPGTGYGLSTAFVKVVLTPSKPISTDGGNQALYACTIGSAEGKRWGLVCSHTFGEREERKRIWCETNQGLPCVGECHNTMVDISKGKHPSKADIALVELDPIKNVCSTDNTVTIEGIQYKLTLKKFPIIRGKRVCILDQNGRLQVGIVRYVSFKDGARGLYDVLGITTLDGKHAIHIPGDSGALILSYLKGNQVSWIKNQFVYVILSMPLL